MYLKKLEVRTSAHSELLNLTRQIEACVEESGVTEGIVEIYCPHTTAGLTINENADPDVKSDFLKVLKKVIPWEDGYRHFEGNSAAHIKASLLGFDQHVIIHKGQLMLGIWQAIYFAEFDGPRHRELYIKIYEC